MELLDELKQVSYLNKKLEINDPRIIIKKFSAISKGKKMTELKKIETTEAPKAIGPYSQAVLAPPIVFISGQLPINPQTGQLEKSDIRLQTNRVLDNLAAILQASHCTFQHVVRCDVFLKDLNDFGIVNEEYAKRFNQPVPPARQTIQVARLPLDALIEISCIAILS
jgi:2-iminobutanoate/2-iminopropanoate deaminase